MADTNTATETLCREVGDLSPRVITRYNFTPHGMDVAEDGVWVQYGRVSDRLSYLARMLKG